MSMPALKMIETNVEMEQPQFTIYQAIECLQHFEFQQNPGEFDRLLNHVRGKKSLLEIGSNFGGSLRRMGEVMAPNSSICCLDLPEPRHKWVEPLHTLKFNCQELANKGHAVKLFLGTSHDSMTRELVRKEMPEGGFDFVFIDGDHSYEGVKQDWEDYGPMGKIVGFHDICGGTEGCVRFWQELKASNKYRVEEYDSPRRLQTTGDHLKLGIGIVFREG
jgi:hypothetical protein